MPELPPRLQFHAEKKVTRKDALAGVPTELQPLARSLFAKRSKLEAWLGKDPHNAQLLISDPEKAIAKAIPGLELPTTLPGSELKKLLLENVRLERVEHEFQQRDVATSDAIRLYGQLLDRVSAGTTTPQQIAADPESMVQAAAAGAFSNDAVSRVVAAVRFVLGLPAPARIVPVTGLTEFIGEPVEVFSDRLRPRPPR